MGSGWGLYLAFLIPPLVLGLAVQWWLQKTFAEQAARPLANGAAGAEIAATILQRNGLDHVEVHHAGGGALSDHYDPRKRAVFLSEPVYAGRSVASAAVGAHETGHAIQHAQAYTFMRIRAAMFPVVAFASSAWIWLLLAGFFLQLSGLVLVAIVLYAAAVLFHFVTLPVEFDASRRALVQLNELGLVTGDERAGAKKVLTAAALTYVAGALAALTQLLYYVLVFMGNRD
jgi:uncharacterized protein